MHPVKPAFVKMSTTPAQMLEINQRIARGEVETLVGTREVLEHIDPATADKVKLHPTPYPLTMELSFNLDIMCAADPNFDFDCDDYNMMSQLVENFGEYEHGSVDVEDVGEGVTLPIYAAVLQDILLQMHSVL